MVKIKKEKKKEKGEEKKKEKKRKEKRPFHGEYGKRLNSRPCVPEVKKLPYTLLYNPETDVALSIRVKTA